MSSKSYKGFWDHLARIILRNRIGILILIVGFTLFLSTQWKYMRFSNTEANLLPDDHIENIIFNEFVEEFGGQENIIAIAVKDSALFELEKFNRWQRLSKQLRAMPEVKNVISTENVEELVRNRTENRFELEIIFKDEYSSQEQLDRDLRTLIDYQPFYEKLLYNRETRTVRSLIYIDDDILNTSVRKAFILEDLNRITTQFEEDTNIDLHISGMPYIRTMNAESIISEIGLFIGAALLVTSLIFFLFFRSYRATIISMSTVGVGVMWAFGILGLLEYEITVLTALIPPLIIVIGIPNCIFLINKYQNEVRNHGNQAKSLQRVITKIGNATLMTNLTTASGFATFIFTNSKLLKEFGIVASINIIGIFILSLLVIPIIYSFMGKPKEKHLKHLENKWIDSLVLWMEKIVREKRIAVYITAIIALVVSIIGIYNIETSGSPIEDMPKNADFVNEIRFFEEEFNAIMPIEIVIDTKRRNGAFNAGNLKRAEELQNFIKETPELAQPISVVNLIKYTKQAYYKGLRRYYQLPTSQERNFLLSTINNSGGDAALLGSFTDSLSQKFRISTAIRDIKTDRMEEIESDLLKRIEKLFPEERYSTYVTGKALLFLKGTKYLVNNLVISLSLAILLISLFMAYQFRSFRMIAISLVPNLLPLLITAGIMGFVGVPIKPSTILVFSIAFGISVDDTIHFLAKYRQELIENNWVIRPSVYAALRETGISMFYTSIVLFFGFSVFTISSFGGTIALGSLVSITLLLAMFSNLILLPSLLLSLERSIANTVTLKEPQIDILPDDSEEDSSSEE